MMELLSPAGSMESLLAAVQNGADAVYFGGSAFNARRYAGNFDDAEMQRAIDHCHIFGRKAYITFNTLILDREMRDALRYAEKLYRMGADALIVQDMGLIYVLRHTLPDFPLHASTQMSIQDADGAAFAEKLGLCLAVLAREVPLACIPEIRAKTSLRLEAFVQGALCMSFSGQCLYSSMAGERSGNRGTCAQPCRKRCSTEGLPGENDRQLSLSDLCMLFHLPALEQAGVDAIKIEGRMKQPAYVAAATRAYRLALDDPNADLNRLKREIDAVFYRGTGTGYYFGDGARTDCVTRKEAELSLAEAVKQEVNLPLREVEFTLSLASGDRPLLKAVCGAHQASVTGEALETAQRPQDAARWESQLRKLGGTGFTCTACRLELPTDRFLPVSAVNELRRQAVEQLNSLLSPRRSTEEHRLPELPERPQVKPRVLAVVRTAQQALAALPLADEVALDPADWGALTPELPKSEKLSLYLPPAALHAAEQEKIRRLLAAPEITGAVINNPGQLDWPESGKRRSGGGHLNVFNGYAAAAWQILGLEDVTLSPELTKPQMRDILRQNGGRVHAYGRAVLMVLHHCPVKEHGSCRSCTDEAGSMTDEAGRKFPLAVTRQAGGCLLRMLNCVQTDVTDLIGELPPCSVTLTFFEETPQEVREKLGAVLASMSGAPQKRTEGTRQETRGHWSRAVD